MTRSLTLLPLLLAAAALSVTRPAHADPIQPEEKQFQLCSGVALKEWGDPKEIAKQAADMGYTVINVRIEKGCWEVKALDEQKNVYELYIHPVSREVVMRKLKLDEPAELPDGKSKP